MSTAAVVTNGHRIAVNGEGQKAIKANMDSPERGGGGGGMMPDGSSFASPAEEAAYWRSRFEQLSR